jgi:hypothetical protein
MAAERARGAKVDGGQVAIEGKQSSSCCEERHGRRAGLGIGCCESAKPAKQGSVRDSLCGCN